MVWKHLWHLANNIWGFTNDIPVGSFRGTMISCSKYEDDFYTRWYWPYSLFSKSLFHDFFHIFVCLLPLFSATPRFSLLLLHRHLNPLQSQSSSRWQCWPLQCKLLLFFPLLLQLTDSARPPADICWPSHFSFSACFISNFPHIIGFVFSWIFVSSLCFLSLSLLRHICLQSTWDSFPSSPWISFHLGKPRLKFRQSYPLFGTFLDLNILSMP